MYIQVFNNYIFITHFYQFIDHKTPSTALKYPTGTKNYWNGIQNHWNEHVSMPNSYCLKRKMSAAEIMHSNNLSSPMALEAIVTLFCLATMIVVNCQPDLTDFQLSDITKHTHCAQMYMYVTKNEITKKDSKPVTNRSGCPLEIILV